MTAFRCEACGRELADDTAFCPYCGADRRPAAVVAPPQPSPSGHAVPPVAVEPAPPAEAAAAPPPSPPPQPSPKTAPVEAAARRLSEPPARRKRRAGCATPLLVVLLLVLAGVSWCAFRHGPSGGAPAVAGATAAQPIRVSRRWRAVRLPGDAPANARFAVSSDTALRVRAGGQLYSVRPRRPLRLPEDAGDSIDVRAADYVSPEDAAHARAALVTLGGG